MSDHSSQDDRTVIATAAVPSTPPIADGEEDGHSLPLGTMIGEFELRAKIGEGGFSIVYLAWDHSLERRVALKEYMPGSIAWRRGQTTVAPRSERHRSTYEAGLKSFVNEAKLLAQFDHPSLVKVYRFWEANGTAYMIMPLYEGPTMKEAIAAGQIQVDEAWLKEVLAPLCDALLLIHREHCFHRDIAPDNVILLKDSGLPLLLDFGAARRVISDMTQALTVILKPGYAPVEQYAELPDMKQGPWTDVYALAATVHWAITGATPPPSVGRLLADQYRPLAELAPAGFSSTFLQALDRALQAHPDKRTRSIDVFAQELGLQASPRAEATRLQTAQRDPAATVIAPGAPLQSANARSTQTPPATTGSQHAGTPAATTPSRRWLAGGAAALALIGAAGWWFSQRQDKVPGPATPLPAPTSIVSEPPPRPVPPPAPAEPVQAVPLPSAAPTTASRPAAESQPASPAAPATVAPATPPQAQKDTTASTSPPRKPPAAKEVAEKPARAEKPAEKHAASSNRSPECAAILQRISLGESSPELMARLEKARCR